jgi:hypothetical protein
VGALRPENVCSARQKIRARSETIRPVRDQAEGKESKAVAVKIEQYWGNHICFQRCTPQPSGNINASAAKSHSAFSRENNPPRDEPDKGFANRETAPIGQTDDSRNGGEGLGGTAVGRSWASGVLHHGNGTSGPEGAHTGQTIIAGLRMT